ncbi:MAG: BlaI/MecI/CopY family transcriptional regulator [Caulobacteraceae bacterium]|nr:BlaI/MecI/CopY family transcriptional regulator [Caulobacteraceae bacterium]
MNITSAESQIMDVLWDGGCPLAVEQIRQSLTTDWTTATVQTLLTRLARKKAISSAKDGRRFLYSPLVRRADYVAGESESLVDRLFGGRVAHLVAQFAEREKLSDQDLEEIKRLIAGIENGR